MKRIVLPVVPVPKPRQTRRDQWLNPPRPPVARYRAFATAVNAWAAKKGCTLPECGAAVRFGLPMPASWSKAKRARMNNTPHQQKPDLDNLAKALMDAMLGEDCGLWHFAGLEKRWAEDGYILITLTPLSPSTP